MMVAEAQAFGVSYSSSNDIHPDAELYDLRIGEPKISPFPSEVFAELKNNKNINSYYPSHGDLNLREMIIEKYYSQGTVNNIAITHGAIGACDFIFRSILNKDTEILLPDPGFPPYVKMAEFAQSKIIKYPINLLPGSRTSIHWDQLENLITAKTKIILLNSPHNPTGKVFTPTDRDHFKSIILKYPHINFIMDEVYRDLIYKDNIHFDFSEHVNSGFIVGSFSKVFPLQGARIGWILTSTNNIKKLSPYLNYAAGAMSSFGQEIAKSVLIKKLDYGKYYFDALLFATKILDSYQVDYIEPEGAFFIFIKYSRNDIVITQELSELGIGVVPGSSFGSNGTSYIRLSFAQIPKVLEKSMHIIGRHWKKTHSKVKQ